MRIKQLSVSLFFVLMVFTSWADQYPRNYNIDILHYKFDLHLSDSSDEIRGTAFITLLFKTTDIKQVRLDLINQSEKLLGKGMRVSTVYYEDGVPRYTHQNDVLLISLLKSPEKNKPYTFVITYSGIPASGLHIGPTRYGARSFFSDDWPNKARHWLPTVDHPYEKATSEFLVTAPAKYSVVSNGLLQEESFVSEGLRLTHWKQSVPVSCWLYVLGVAEFAVQQVGIFDHKQIQTWVHPQDREAGFRDFAAPTAAVLQYFSDYVGPFVYEKLANIQSASVTGGMEASSAIFYAENLVNGKADTRLRNVVIHELAHQWFGNAVTESTWDDAWLSEGFATFFTLLFQEHEYGHEEYTDGLIKARNTVFSYYKKDSLYTIVADRSAETGEVTNIITYQKGAWTLHMLRDLIGNEKFKKGIQAYYTRFINANANTADFIKEMEQASGIRLTSFFNQWIYRPGFLKIKAVWQYDPANNQVIIRAEQSGDAGFLYDTPVEFEIIDGENTPPRIMRFMLKEKTAEFKIPCTRKPVLITPDPRTVLLADIQLTKKKGN